MSSWNSLDMFMKRQDMAMPTPEELAFTNAPQILSITGTFFAAAAFVFLLRVYVRICMLKIFGIDDYVMALAMILCTATFACFVIKTEYGLGKHLSVMYMDPIAYMKFSKVLYVHSLLVMVGVSCVKISIAFFLLRLSINKSFHRFMYLIIVFMVIFTFACAMTLIFQCIPVAAAWDMALRPPPLGVGTAKCYSFKIFLNLGLMNSSFNIVSDVLFATIPIPLIWKLQLNVRTKVSLIGILSLGWFACAAAVIKAVQQYHVFEDMDWTVHDSFNVWNYIEFTLGIIAASLPTIKPLFIRFLETARALTSGGRTKNSAYNPTGYKTDSLGYHRQQEEFSNRSVALKSLNGRGDLTPQNPYNVRITTNHLPGTANKEAWDMVQAKNSDESVIPLHQSQLREGPGQHGIVMTREVRVSR